MSTRTHYTQIPHVVDDSDLSPHAFRLYCHIKRVAGDSGECWQSTKVLAEACKMSTGMVSKARQELLDGGWIEKTGTGVNGAWVCRVVDVWEQNQNAGSKIVHNMNDLDANDNKDRSQYEQSNANRSQYERNRSQYETKNNTKEEPMESVPADAGSPPPDDGADKPLTAHQKYFGKVCEIIGWDSKTLTEGQKGQVAQTVGKLKDAGYTQDDLDKFGREVWVHDWRWQKNKSYPTLSQLRAEIGKLKNNGAFTDNRPPPTPNEQKAAFTQRLQLEA